MTNTLFPIFLKTETFQFLIVGGGRIGLEKTQTLLKQNPDISLKIVATEICAELKEIFGKFPHIVWEERSFQDLDLEDAHFVVIATENTVLNQSIKEKANERRILVNAADQPDLCDFYLGAIVNKGNLKIAISTNGKSPVLARRMREHLEEAIPNTINDSIEELNAFRKSHKGEIERKIFILNKSTAILAKKSKEKNSEESKKYQKLVFQLSIVFAALFAGYGFSNIVTFNELQIHLRSIPSEFYGMILIGFLAQLIDGAVGLGYGLTCATSMMLLGIRLPAISGSIHTAEMFSSGIAGFSHYKFGNVNKKLFFWLAGSGVVGAVLGAFFLSYLGSRFESITYGILAIYTMLIGIRLITIAFRKKIAKKKVKNIGLLGFSGGFLDAFSGGGWGPIVTSTLLAKGRKSSYVVGTVSLSEFFVTFATSLVFFSILGVSHWYIIVGLILGGSLAAPLAAKLAGKLPQKTALILVALLVIVFSMKILFKLFA